MAGRQTRTRSRTSKKRATRRDAPGGLAIAAETRREIYGIVLAALALTLAISVLTTSAGVLPRAVADGLRAGLGLGAYVVPVFVLVWAATFFARRLEIDEANVGIGLGISFLSIVSMLALGAPPETQWEPSVLATHGGYVGAAVAFALRPLLGTAISYVVLVAALLVGAVVAGASITELVDRVRGWLPQREEPLPVPRPVRRGQKTLPVAEFDAEGFDADAAPGRRAKAVVADPEARKKTLPTTKVVAPKAMEGFELPAPSLLARSPAQAAHQASERELKTTAGIIEQTLATFDIGAKVRGWVPGPTVTMFKVELARGVKVNRITALADDLALSLAATTVRILAPIPGESLVGIEVPNERRSTVTLGDVLSPDTLATGSPLLLGIGKDVAGDSIVADLASMPHLLIAGATGTGKSVCINALLTSILMRATPAEVRLILIDPKRIELSLYNGVPHLYVGVVTEAKEAASALAWAVSEMESRLKRLQKAGARNIGQYNASVQAGTAPEDAEEMPYLVIVIDELADLMMVAAKEVEDSICRIAQLARAAGIHLIVATQRPSTDIITGLIKTNITNRIAFAVSSGIDSRVILDQTGAEKLVGLGDLLYSTPAWPKPKRIQGAFVSEDEISAVVGHLKQQAEPEYHDEILHLKVAQAGGGIDTGEDDDDPLLWEAADIVVTSGMGSTSMLQRRLKVGYARAGRIMDMLEAKGVVGPPDGSKPRDVLCDVEDLESIKVFERHEAAEG